MRRWDGSWARARCTGLERQLALAKSFAEDMRRAHAELEDHCTTLDEEAEKLQDEVGCPMEVEEAAG